VLFWESISSRQSFHICPCSTYASVWLWRAGRLECRRGWPGLESFGNDERLRLEYEARCTTDRSSCVVGIDAGLAVCRLVTFYFDDERRLSPRSAVGPRSFCPGRGRRAGRRVVEVTGLTGWRSSREVLSRVRRGCSEHIVGDDARRRRWTLWRWPTVTDWRHAARCVTVEQRWRRID